MLAAESDEGQVEYKLRLRATTPARFQQLVTQLKWRLSEGSGQCFYYLGVEDNGHPKGLLQDDLDESVQVLHDMAAEVAATAEIIQTPEGSSVGHKCAVVRVSYRTLEPSAQHTDLRVAVAGGVDSGKSTLIAVLTRGSDNEPTLDNGRGSARMAIFKHKHEIETGRTSSISHSMLAYDEDSNVLNYANIAETSPGDVARAAVTVVRFSDLGGHEKYSKTSLYGMTCTRPDYTLLCISALNGLSWITREHLVVAISLGIAPFVVITKTDLIASSQEEENDAVGAIQQDVYRLACAAVDSVDSAFTTTSVAFSPRQQDGQKFELVDELAPLITTVDQAKQAAHTLNTHRASTTSDSNTAYRLSIPIFAVSSVTGQGIDVLHAFLSNLSPCCDDMNEIETSHTNGHLAKKESGGSGDILVEEPAQVQVDASFEVSGVGLVIGGTVLAGTVCLGDELLLGPEDVNISTASDAITSVTDLISNLSSSSNTTAIASSWRLVKVSGIQRAQVDVMSVRQGQHASLAVQPVVQEEEGEVVREENMTIDEETHDQRSSSVGEEEEYFKEALTRSWSFAEQTHVGTPTAQGGHMQQQHQSSTSRLPRKGTVLLAPSLNPEAVTEFEAVLVLLDGQWPPRGLVSGVYPPVDDAIIPEGSTVASPTTNSNSGYVVSIFCGSVRQSAKVLSMAEISLKEPWIGGIRACGSSLSNTTATSSSSSNSDAESCHNEDATSCSGVSRRERDLNAIKAGLAAAGVLSCDISNFSSNLDSLNGNSSGGDSTPMSQGKGPAAADNDDVNEQEGIPCVVRVVFRFMHRPEWLSNGMRLIVRDKSGSRGRVAAAGYVCSVALKEE